MSGGCTGAECPASGTDAGTSSDAGPSDAGTSSDAGPSDAGLPVDAGTSSDAGPSDAGPPVDAGNPLIVTDVVTYYTRNGVVPQPRDFTASPAQLLVFDGGTPVTLSGTAEGPGRMRFDVPPGTYIVKAAANRYVVTSGRLVELGIRRFGRPDRGGNLYTSSPVSAPLMLTGLEPTHAPGTVGETSFELSSLDVEESGYFELASSLNDGQTTLSDPDAKYFSRYNSIPRFDATQGDSVWVLQYEGRDAGTPADSDAPWTSTGIVAAAHVDPYSFDGGALSLKATLSPTVQRGLHIEWHREEFEALRSASASAPSNDSYFEFYPMLRDARDGFIDYAISSLLSFYTNANEPQTLVTRDVAYGNPYPSAWEPMANFYTSYTFRQASYNGSRFAFLSEASEVHMTLAELASRPAIRPLISMPRDLKVEGQPAFPSRMLDTLTPLVTWEPPQLGTPSDYYLSIRRLAPTGTARILVARIFMAPEHRSVRLPPGLLSSGNTYYLELTVSHADPLPAGQLPSMRYVLPYTQATTVSGLLTTP